MAARRRTATQADAGGEILPMTKPKKKRTQRTYRGETVEINVKQVQTKPTTYRKCWTCDKRLDGELVWRVAGKGDYLSSEDCGFGVVYFCIGCYRGK